MARQERKRGRHKRSSLAGRCLYQFDATSVMMPAFYQWMIETYGGETIQFHDRAPFTNVPVWRALGPILQDDIRAWFFGKSVYIPEDTEEEREKVMRAEVEAYNAALDDGATEEQAVKKAEEARDRVARPRLGHPRKNLSARTIRDHRQQLDYADALEDKIKRFHREQNGGSR